MTLLIFVFYAYFRLGWVKINLGLPRRVRKGVWIGNRRVWAPQG